MQSEGLLGLKTQLCLSPVLWMPSRRGRQDAAPHVQPVSLSSPSVELALIPPKYHRWFYALKSTSKCSHACEAHEREAHRGKTPVMCWTR